MTDMKSNAIIIGSQVMQFKACANCGGRGVRYGSMTIKNNKCDVSDARCSDCGAELVTEFGKLKDSEGKPCQNS